MNKIPTKIDLNDWEKFGGGYTSETYYHKTDDGLMLKLYQDFMPATEALHELEVSEAILKTGVPVAKPIEYVSDGKSFGAVFERLQNKRSIARILADEPERLDEMAMIFAEQAKLLHSTECDTSLFPSQDALMIDTIKSTELFPSSVKDKALDLIDRTPKCTTGLHGDFHIGNIVITEGKPVFIDLADYSYGAAIYDDSQMYLQVIDDADERVMPVFHITGAMLREYWEHFKKYYFDDPDVCEERLAPYIGLASLKYMIKLGFKKEGLMKIFNRFF